MNIERKRKIIEKVWLAAIRGNTSLLSEVKELYPEDTSYIEYLYEKHRNILEESPYLGLKKGGA